VVHAADAGVRVAHARGDARAQHRGHDHLGIGRHVALALRDVHLDRAFRIVV
jgi:hypothetical protein